MKDCTRCNFLQVLSWCDLEDRVELMVGGEGGDGDREPVPQRGKIGGSVDLGQ